MPAVIDRYLKLPAEEKLLCRIGRRGGALRSVDELSNTVPRARIETASRALCALGPGGVEESVNELADRYIYSGSIRKLIRVRD